MDISAVQGRASLENMDSQIDGELESLDNAVVLDSAVSLRATSPASRIIGYSVRGLMAGLIVAIIALYLPPVRRRFATKR